MANPEHEEILKRGIEVWNKWRKENPNIRPDLSKANLLEINLFDEDQINAFLSDPDLVDPDLVLINLSGADLSGALIVRANLMGANLREADLSDATLTISSLCAANLSGAELVGTNLMRANLMYADLTGANLFKADLFEADLSEATLINANLLEALLSGTKLYGADLSGANLYGASLLRTNLEKANLTGCRIHGISAWDLQLEGCIQSNLIITDDDEPIITVDNLELAQFIYLLLNNQKVRQTVETITSQVVLILGRFHGERKTILETLKYELRARNYSPVVVDSENLDYPDLRETVRTLANMARFVLVDLTDLEDALDEIVEVVSHCRVPLQPLLFSDAYQYQHNRFLALRRKHHWLLPPYSYQDRSDLLVSLQEKVIQPAEKKNEDLKQKKLIQLFLCYALEDAKLAAKLKKHLSLLERSGHVAIWDDQKLVAGEEKGKEIERHLSSAHIVLLLVSPDFLSSDDCIIIQERAMEQHERGDTIVIPLILHLCAWQSTPLSELQVLPRDKKPLARRNLDDILFEVTDSITDVIKELL